MPATATDRLNGLTTSVAVKAPVRAVSTVNLTLAGLQTVGGVALAAGDRVLVKNQSSAIDNGIYVANTGSWSRSADFDGNRDVVQFTIIPIDFTMGLGAFYQVTSANPIVIGSTALTFALHDPNVAFPRTSAEITAAVTPTDFTIPSHDVLGYVNPARYGMTLTTIATPYSGALGAATYAALVKANSVANAAACPIKAKPGVYDYAPSALILLEQPFEGNGGHVTLRCDSGYTGIYFQQPTSTAIRRLYGFTTGFTKIGTFLRQMAVNTFDFTGHQILEEVLSLGFAKCLEVGNTFLNTYKDCRFEEGGFGLHCVPPYNGGNNGYITTHVYENCSFFGNDQDILVTSTLQSRGMKFTSGGIEQPQISTATFTRVRGLDFDGSYFEGGDPIAALTLHDCSATIRGQGYFNQTGGIHLGTNTEIVIENYRVGDATSVLTGGDSTQTVTLIDCQFPDSGNSMSFAKLVMINTKINGVFYKLYANNDDIAFTPVLEGSSGAGTPTYTIQNGYYNRVGSLIHYRGTVAISAKGGMTGSLRIGGFPFTAVNQTNGVEVVPILHLGLTNTASYTSFAGRMSPNSNKVDIVENGSGQSVSLVPVANAADSTTIQFSGWAAVA